MNRFLKQVIILGLVAIFFCSCNSQEVIGTGQGEEVLCNLNGEELIETEEDVLVGTLPFVNNNKGDFGYTIDGLKELLSNTTAKYLWFEHPEYEESKEGVHNVYSVSEETFWTNVKREHGLWGEIHQDMSTIYDETDTIRRLAELHLTKLTRDGRETSDGFLNTYYLSYWMDNAWQCLDGAVVNTNEPYEYFEEHGLKLAVNNAQASTILAGAGNMSSIPYYGVLVTAEVGKVQNTGQFKDLYWIPESGQNLVTFMVFFDYQDMKNVGKRSNIVDIAVLDYEPIENENESF